MKAVTKKAMSLLLSVTLAVCSFAGASASGAESNVEDSCYDSQYDSNFDSGAYRYHVTDSGKNSGNGIWDSGYVTLKTVDSGKADNGSSYSVRSKVTHKDEAGKHNTHNYEVNAIDTDAFTKTEATSITFGEYSVKAGEGGYIGIYKDSGADDVYAVAFADKAYSFNGWDTGDENLLNKNSSLDLTGNEGKTVTAQFSKIEQPVEPVPVTSAEISGTPQVGETLTASANTDATGTLTYQWKECDTAEGSYTNIDGATNSTFKLTADQKGKYIEVEISGDNNSSAISDATEKVADAPEKSSDATLQSTIGTVDDGAGTITDIPAGTTLADFKAAITPATGATFEVYEADETIAATDLKSGYKVIVTAEDGSTKTYTLTVKAAPEKSEGSGSGSSSSGSSSHHHSSHHHSSNSGSTTGVPAAPSTPSLTFVSDTTTNFTVNGSYQFKITSKDGKKPAFVIGTPGVFTTQFIGRSGNDYFFKITAVGASGSKAGIYVNGQKLLVATVGSTALGNVQCDTTLPFKIKAGASYTFKLTAKSKPTFVCGNGSVFAVSYAGQKNNNYFFKAKAVGKTGNCAGFYINGSKVPCTVSTVS